MMDLIQRGALNLNAARFVVLDEADEMLDLGFIEDVERILRMCPSGRQTDALQRDDAAADRASSPRRTCTTPITISITPKKLTVDTIEQAYVEVDSKAKTDRLIEVLKAEEPEQAIVFCRTKIGTARLDKNLRDRGIPSKALHGDMSQGQRDGVMISFKEQKSPLLVATDVAARGLDIEHVTHVINFDLPNNTEIYVHRIGRTGRVGRTGRAITFVTPKEREEIQRIEREAKTSIGEWEAPEDRIEHAPRPRRRDHSDDKVAKKEAAPDPSNGDNGHRKLFINRGERSGFGEENIRWALTEGAVIPENAIHDVRVLERFSFVDIDAEFAEQALERLDGTKLEGRQIRVEYAKG